MRDEGESAPWVSRVVPFSGMLVFHVKLGFARRELVLRARTLCRPVSRETRAPCSARSACTIAGLLLSKYSGEKRLAPREQFVGLRPAALSTCLT